MEQMIEVIGFPDIDTGDPPPTADELRAEIATLEREETHQREHYHALYARRQTDKPTREAVVDFLLAEDELRYTTQRLETLRPLYLLTRATEAAWEAKAVHDEGMAESQAQATSVVDLLGTVTLALRELVRRFDVQVDKLFAPRTRRGEQAFPVDGGRYDAERLFAALWPGDPRTQAAFALLLEGIHEGAARQALAACPRLQPFSETIIESYIASLETFPTEGMSHVSTDL